MRATVKVRVCWKLPGELVTNYPSLIDELHVGDRVMLTVTARDRLGVLSGVCRTLADLGANIESLQARSRHGIASDTFLLAGAPGLPELEQAFGM